MIQNLFCYYHELCKYIFERFSYFFNCRYSHYRFSVKVWSSCYDQIRAQNPNQVENWWVFQRWCEKKELSKWKSPWPVDFSLCHCFIIGFHEFRAHRQYRKFSSKLTLDYANITLITLTENRTQIILFERIAFKSMP